MTQASLPVIRLAGALLIATSAAGCATEEFVHEQVGPVRTQAQQAQSTADQAQNSANQAQGTANDALQRAMAAHKLAEGKFRYQVVLSDDSVKFPVNGDQLSPEAQARLSELAQRLNSENKNVYLEIQGFTDARGSARRNMQLGEARADTVRRFLYRQGVALNRMATISYGEDDPVASNATAEGRAQNRRVAIVVLS
jgi:outer membrane protein OmpA-like peptidoglycan-associated protein